ncbi:MAG: HAMP domain-containing histidine kinase [Alphaproteobacteria bacterium]|nr:HAMP domain-containing histidine kinase [Alphaproteobacteria bacterium]
MSIGRVVNWVLLLILVLFTVQTIVIVYAVHTNQNAQETEKETGKVAQISSIIETVLALDNVSLGVMASLQPFSDFFLVYPVPEGFMDQYPSYRTARLLQARLQGQVEFQRSNEDTPDRMPTVQAFWTSDAGEDSLPPLALRNLIIKVDDPVRERSFVLQAKATSVLTYWLSRIIVFYGVSSVLIVILGFWIFRVTTKPFLELQKASEALARDGTYVPVTVQGSGKLRDAFDAFNAMQKRVTGLLEERRRMIAALSHDLKTILTRFSLRVDYIDSGMQREKAFSDIAAMTRTLDQMVMYAKSEEALKPSLQDVALPILLKQAIGPFETPSFKIIWRDVPEELSFVSDPVFLERIVQNIVSNASRYASILEISVHRDSNEVCLDFADNGSGIPDAEKEEVFTPYYSADSARTKNQAGSGLGFMIIRNFTLLLGGRVELEDHQPQGLIVRIILPVLDPEGSAPP